MSDLVESALFICISKQRRHEKIRRPMRGQYISLIPRQTHIVWLVWSLLKNDELTLLEKNCPFKFGNKKQRNWQRNPAPPVTIWRLPRKLWCICLFIHHPTARKLFTKYTYPSSIYFSWSLLYLISDGNFSQALLALGELHMRLRTLTA